MAHLRVGLLVAFWAMAAQADGGPRDLPSGDGDAAFHAVGRLDLDGRGFCTATLLTADLVLTAAHCVLDEAGRPVQPGMLAFSAGLRDGLAAAHRRGRRVAVADGYDPARGDLANLAIDVALVVLDRPVDTGQVAPIPAGRSGGRRVGIVSYAHDRAEEPAIEEACDVLDRREGALILSCRGDFGMSGAPVLRRGSAGLRVVGVVSAMAEADGAWVSIGADLAGLQGLRDRIDGAAPTLARGAREGPVMSRRAARRDGSGGFPHP